MTKDFLKVSDASKDELESLLRRAAELKAGKDANSCPLIGKNIGLFFEKPSTRTRLSFEAGIYQLGGNSICMTPAELQLGRGETIPDTARTLSRYLDAVMMRTYSHATIEQVARNSSIPVINGLSDLHHPCQALADVMTLVEKKGRIEGLRLAYVGDGNNVCNSLIEAAAVLGFTLVIASPEGFEPHSDILAEARHAGAGEIVVLRDPREAAASADAVYTDVWVSMGQEKDAADKKRRFAAYQVNSGLLACAKKDVIVLHCLPAHRGEEITDEVMDGPHSVVFDQAENRLHTQKALLEFLLKRA
ncbi:MAG: ornithine carbamoyltransferase [Thermodesulfovibrionales bacterium]